MAVTPKIAPLAQSALDKLRSGPFGAVLGAVAGGGLLWLAPEAKPAGWTDQSFVALCTGAGLVLERLLAGASGWFVGPTARHLGARWEARLALRKLDRYRKLGLLDERDARRLAVIIARADVNGGKRDRSRIVTPRKKPRDE